MATNKEIVLVTGANVGIGSEIAKQLLRDHGDRFYVLVGSRTLSKGEAAVRELHNQGITGCEVIHIDVIENDSITKAAKTVEQKFGRLDVLHANAGIAPDKDMPGEPISKILRETLRTNVEGAAQVAETFAPLLSKAENPRVIFTSSSLGSAGRISEFRYNKDWPAYSTSKAALNMMMIWFADMNPEWKVNACCPGFRATALNNFATAGKQIPTPGSMEDSAKNAVRLTLLDKDGETMTFTSRDDKTGKISTVPW